LSFNTNEVAALIAAGQGGNCKLEIEVAGGGIRQTYQQASTLSDDIITSTSPTPAPVGSSGFNMIAGNGDVYQITIDNDGVLTAAKQ
jgi:hypothetical protein